MERLTSKIQAISLRKDDKLDEKDERVRDKGKNKDNSEGQDKPITRDDFYELTSPTKRYKYAQKAVWRHDAMKKIEGL